MVRLAAAVVLATAMISTATIEGAPALDRALALDTHRAAGHQAPEHHLQEARRALDRAWQKSKGDDRKSLEALRTDFAALALAYANIPAEARSAEEPSAAGAGTSGVPGAVGTAGTAGADLPAKTTGVTPPASTCAQPLTEWQRKYGEVERDLKTFDTADRALKTRIDHVRTHLEMFYASALGKSSNRP